MYQVVDRKSEPQHISKSKVSKTPFIKVDQIHFLIIILKANGSRINLAK